MVGSDMILICCIISIGNLYTISFISLSLFISFIRDYLCGFSSAGPFFLLYIIISNVRNIKTLYSHNVFPGSISSPRPLVMRDQAVQVLRGLMIHTRCLLNSADMYKSRKHLIFFMGYLNCLKDKLTCIYCVN